MASRWRPRMVLSAVLAAFACGVEEPSTVEIVVRTEPPVRGAVSFPAEVLVGFDAGSGYLVFRVGFVCSPDAPFSSAAMFSVPGSAGTTLVDAWLAPADGGAFPCGPLAAPQPRPSRRGSPDAPRASARAVILAGCGAGEVGSATVVIGGST